MSNMSQDDEEFKDPALKHFNRGTFVVKNTVMETLKGAVIGALVGGVIFGVLAATGGLLALATIPVVGPLIAAAVGLSGVGTGAVLSAAMTGAMWGAGLGAAGTGIMAVSHAQESADDEEQRLITKNQQLAMRRQRAEAMEQRRDLQRMALQQQTMGMHHNPNQALPSMGGAEQAV